MPNHITNVLSFPRDVDGSEFSLARDILKGESDRDVDFNNLVSMLKTLDPAFDPLEDNNIPREELKFFNHAGVRIDMVAFNLANHGHADWYDWRREYWGTKWNAYHIGIGSDDIQFDTAWSGVLDLMKVLSSKMPDVLIRYKYADEDTGCNTGFYELKAGVVIADYSPSDGSRGAYELAFEINGCGDYYELVDGNYRYKDDD